MRRSLVTCIFLVIFLFPATHLPAQTTRPEIIEQGDGVYYIVQKGDTLWDISEKLFNTPWFWPGLWAENNFSIDSNNPHWIYPGQKLRLLTRDETLRSQDEEEESLTSSYLYTPMQKVGFITPEPAEVAATIIATDAPRYMITSEHMVYLKPGKDFELFQGKPPLGGRYIIYSKPEKIYNKAEGNKKAGYLHRISGIVEISEYRGEFVIGTVIAAFLPIHIGDFLLPVVERDPRVTFQPSVPNLTARILASDSGQVMCAQGDVIYINRGTRDGVAPGQVYHLLEERTVGFSSFKKDQRTDKAPIGAILVLDARETASAAFIIGSTIDAFPGFLVESPLQ